jgi:hypothetical protein
MDVRLEPGASYNQPIPEGHTVVAYVYQGRGEFGASGAARGEIVDAVRMIVFGDGDYLQVGTPPDSSLSFMLMAGMPFNEPIVPYGPFVMNTVEEIQQTLIDLRNGTFVQG